MSRKPPDRKIPASIKRQIDRVCDEFERVWNSNQQPRIEDYLDRVPDGRSVLLFELVKVEVDLRMAAGEQVDEHIYQERFPDDVATVKFAFAGLADTVSIQGNAQTAHPFGSARGQTDPVSAIESGDKIGKYTVQRMVGQGGFGIVYLARHPQLDIDVAIKIPRAGRFRGSSEVEKFLEDARHAASLKHPGIVTIHDVDQDDGLLFIVQEFLSGGDLKKSLRTQAYAAADAARLIAIVADAVAHAHKHGVYHRDLKPANILLDESGQPRVADFGLALRERSRGLHKGEVCGTPPYMAPEQVRGEAHRIDGRCDVWGLGVILYEMLAARKPFSGETNNELFDHILYSEPPPPRQIAPELPPELERICLKCLSKRMADRYTTANDLADDLRNWLTNPLADSSPVPSKGEPKPRKIVPKFLRSFDQEDRDFFLELLAGPRDRDGLPDSIRFWKTRIEERDPDHTFPVGLLYGPSGCGKSSLVKAGLLPQLGNDVVQVYVEATPDETELRLLKELRKRFPGSSQDVALPEMLEGIREGSSLPTGQKLLIVFDQFEQWLHTHNADPESQLVQALRQCDGGRLQALLMVRDDFWMGATRFLQELETELIQGHNLAAVDRFDLRHASKVLQLFGQAYGALPDESVKLSREQQVFMNESVKALAEDGRVVSIRLALFAHMIKAKPWTPATLKEAGGAEGIAVAFLDETFNSREANPKHRLHAAAIQRVLQQLLPVSGVAIKGQMKSHDELLQASQCRAQEFDQVLGILNDELGLITPTDPLGETLRDDDTLPADSAGRFYQLTHDYLVPALRQWLTRNHRATRRGRAQLLLTELAEAWNRKPESRRLPTLLESLSIHWWTKRAERSACEKRMLRAALRRMSARGALAAVSLVVLMLVGQQVNGRFQASALLKRLGNADTTQLPFIIPEIGPYKHWLTPSLEAELATTDTGPQRLKIVLALAELEPRFFGDVMEHLPTVPVEHVDAVSRVLQRNELTVLPLLSDYFAVNEKMENQGILPVAVALARLSPDDERWPSLAPSISRQLARTKTTQLSQWIDLFSPVSGKLAPQLANLYVADEGLSDSQRGNLVEAISQYSAEDPESWSRAVEAASQSELKVLLSAERLNSTLAAEELRNRLASLDVPDSQTGLGTTEVEFDQQLRKTIEAAGGFLDNDAALVQRLKRKAFDELDRSLTEQGYRAVCVRPYSHKSMLQVAAVWHRDDGQGTIHWDLDSADVAKTDLEMRNRDLAMVDFARYHDPKPRWVAVWSEAKSEQQSTRNYLAATLEDHRRNEAEWCKQGFAIERFDVHLDEEGVPRCSAIWKATQIENVSTFTDWRYRRAFGDLSPGSLQTDCRVVGIAPTVRDALAFHKHLSQALAAEKGTPSELKADTKMLMAAKYLSAMGQYKEAVPILREVAGRRQAALVHEQFGVLYGRSGSADGLKMAVDRYAQFENQKPGMLQYLRLCAAILSRDVEEISTCLANLEELHATDDGTVELSARAYARVEQVEVFREHWPMAGTRALELLRKVIVEHRIQTPEVLLFDIDFDSLRNHAEFADLITELGFDQRYCVAYGQQVDAESRQLFDLTPQEHRRSALSLRQEGFVPQAISVSTSTKSNSKTCCSVWHGSVQHVAGRIAVARQRANLALALADLKQPQELIQHLLTSKSRDTRSHVMTVAPAIIEPSALVQALATADSDQDRRILLLVLGGYDAKRFSTTDRSSLQTRLQEFAVADEPGLRSAAVWCLGQWGLSIDGPPKMPKSPAESPAWYANPAGQVMIELKPPQEFLMGSPRWEPSRDRFEDQFWARVGRSYSLSATETTHQSLRVCLEDEQVKKYLGRRTTPPAQYPLTGITWRQAAMFCQWLSEQDPEITADQYCYPGIWDVDAEEVRLPDDYLMRTGYRLPTEMEWEWAARAGSTSSRPSGYDDTVLAGFEWFSPSAGGRMHTVGTRRPNDFGFFDMLGNVHEWCDDLQHVNTRSLDDYIRIDNRGNSHLPNEYDKCVIRGGSYKTGADKVRSANRSWQVAEYLSDSVGFRVARTLSSKQQALNGLKDPDSRLP